jgi:hypothetical protein
MKRQIDTEVSPTESYRQVALSKHSVQIPIRATLVGSNRCEALGVTGRGYAPVFALCRALVTVGHDTRRSLHAYRSETLALVVGSIRDGAKLRVATHGVGFERIPECTASPPIGQIGPTMAKPGSDGKRVRAAATRKGQIPLSGMRRRR